MSSVAAACSADAAFLCAPSAGPCGFLRGFERDRVLRCGIAGRLARESSPERHRVLARGRTARNERRPDSGRFCQGRVPLRRGHGGLAVGGRGGRRKRKPPPNRSVDGPVSGEYPWRCPRPWVSHDAGPPDAVHRAIPGVPGSGGGTLGISTPIPFPAGGIAEFMGMSRATPQRGSNFDIAASIPCGVAIRSCGPIWIPEGTGR
jgi:hypothetical protein